MKEFLIKVLLWILNTNFLNNTPCKYGFIGNIDAFEKEHLESEERQRPGITVKTILQESKTFSKCPVGSLFVNTGLTFKVADQKDIDDLKKLK